MNGSLMLPRFLCGGIVRCNGFMDGEMLLEPITKDPDHVVAGRLLVDELAVTVEQESPCIARTKASFRGADGGHVDAVAPQNVVCPVPNVVSGLKRHLNIRPPVHADPRADFVGLRLVTLGYEKFNHCDLGLVRPVRMERPTHTGIVGYAQAW